MVPLFSPLRRKFILPWRYKEQEISPSAEGDKGYAPLTAPPFEERKQTRKRDLREFASQTVADENFFNKGVKNEYNAKTA